MRIEKIDGGGVSEKGRRKGKRRVRSCLVVFGLLLLISLIIITITNLGTVVGIRVGFTEGSTLGLKVGDDVGDTLGLLGKNERNEK